MLLYYIFNIFKCINNRNVKMNIPCYNYLLVFLFCVVFPNTVLSAFINISHENVPDENVSSTNTISFNYSLNIQEEYLNQSADGCDCGNHSYACLILPMQKMCICHTGYVQTSRRMTATCEKCECGSNSYACEFEDGVKKCNCYVGYTEFQGKCQPKECDCGPYSSFCKLDKNDNKNCICKEGYAATHYIPEFNQTCKECNCGVGSTSCQFFGFPKKKCTCKKGYAPINDRVSDLDECKKCDCGPHSDSCTFSHGIKKCNCFPGYTEFQGTCQRIECDCGINSIFCKFDENKRKNCTCKDGYAPTSDFPAFDQTCEKCDCGVGGASCRFRGFKEKKCTCRKGYALFIDFRGVNTMEECKLCDCGVNAISCSYKLTGKKKCVCGEKSALTYEYGTNEEVCQNCDCGPNSISCRLEHNFRKCTCAKGYTEETIKWDNTCVKVKEIRNNWRLATYILLGIFAAILVVMIRIIRSKSSVQ